MSAHKPFMERIGVVAGGWHYPLSLYRALAAQADNDVDLFCIGHRSPDTVAVFEEKAVLDGMELTPLVGLDRELQFRYRGNKAFSGQWFRTPHNTKTTGVAGHRAAGWEYHNGEKMASPRIAIVIAEYGKAAPDVSQYRECWPEADIQVFGGNDLPETPRLDPAHPRYGWRMNDWGKIRKCLDSGSDVAISFDADMWIRDRDAARQIVPLAMTFGICMPINPRYVVKRDFVDGADTPACIDQTTWYGPSFNCSPVAINLGSKRSVWLAEEYCRIILQTPQRGPLAWWEAMKFTGVTPLPLPPQFCVCERHIGVGDEAILHMGHASVARHYGKKVS